MRRLRSFLTSFFQRRRRRSREQPWTIAPAEIKQRFDGIRSAIPVDDDELRRARPVTQRQHICA